jgi:hypothetical protein
VSTVTQSPKRSVVVLKHDDQGYVTVVPSDEDRFTINIRHAVQSLSVSSRLEEFRDQFNLLLKELGQWLSLRDDWRDAFVTLRDGALVFVVVRNSVLYSDEFEDDLSDLDIRIANDQALELVRIHSVALPPVPACTLDTFLDSRFTIGIAHAERDSPHPASQQER